MKPNVVGFVGGVIALVSLALPWWTMTATELGIGVSAEVSIYPYQATACDA